MQNYDLPWTEEHFDVVMHLDNDRRKSLRFLTSDDCIDVAVNVGNRVDHELWMTMATALVGHTNLEAAYKAGVFKPVGSEATE